MTTAARFGAAIGAALLLLMGTATGAIGATGHDGKKSTPRVTNAVFGAAPASAAKKGAPIEADGRTEFVYNTTPGNTLPADHIEISNYSYKPEKLYVYTVDAVPATNGTISFPAHSAKRLEAGAWMSVGTPHGRGYVIAEPRSTTILPIHIVVPKNASPGDHVGAVIVSLIGQVSSKFGHSGTRLGFEQRIAIKAEFRISGPLHPRVSIEDLKGSYTGPIDPFADGTATISYVLKNSGNVVIGGPQSVTIHGLFGKTVVAKDLPVVPALLPGAAYPVTVKVPKIYPQLLMTGKVTFVEAGLQGQVDPGLHPISGTVHFVAIPWVIVIAILVLLFLVVFAVLRRRKKKDGLKSGGQRTQPDSQGVNA